ncbi:hypothetical protein PRUPE_6G153700 [Prunus persica]|uniref:Aminotransferase-like plant mobile domain-containing protein n=1 Tax=Prunus persica TaxID=3760 RepID=A0A251NQV5_PRUPE|nr:hypothetical protein PRUPE_6G153700 [Prunus persica]
MKCGKLSHSMCRFLVDKLNPCKSSIVLHEKTLKISVDDFVRIMGVKDGGEEVDFTGSMHEQHIVKKLLKSNELKQMMVGTEEAGDFFKVGFAMFALCTLLCPTTSVYVNLKYLLLLRDSKAIARKNLASYSFKFLLDSFRSFKENNQVYIGGCMLFLQLFYLDAIAHGSVLMDRPVLPFAARPEKQDRTPNDQGDNVKGFANLDKTLAPSVEVIRERKHAKRLHNEIMKRLNVGPFRMTNDISEDDRDLLSFAFCCNPLDPKAWRYTLNQICENNCYMCCHNDEHDKSSNHLSSTSPTITSIPPTRRRR